MMGRRRQSDEIAFGSDSFLDIVANIVGILIILIVIAGVRVSHAPVALPASSERVPTESVAVIEPPQIPVLEDLPPGETIAAIIRPPVVEPEIEEEPEPIELPPVSEAPPLSRELVAQVDELKQRLGALKQLDNNLSGEAQTLLQSKQSLQQRIAVANQTLEAQQQSMIQDQQTISSENELLEARQRELAGLQVALAEADAKEAPTTVLKHSLTPVGRKVEGKEVHFLLSGGRVSVVPLEEMGKELMSVIQQKLAQILRMDQYVGSIGPIKGFRMDYVVARQPMTIIDELRRGSSVMAGIQYEFQLHPQSGLITESAEQALHHHGRFLAAVRQAGPDASLTFWVYPDSFDLHRTLQEFAQSQGFEVAARPLPVGVPIGGSPQGSRSVAQ